MPIYVSTGGRHVATVYLRTRAQFCASVPLSGKIRACALCVLALQKRALSTLDRNSLKWAIKREESRVWNLQSYHKSYYCLKWMENRLSRVFSWCSSHRRLCNVTYRWSMDCSVKTNVKQTFRRHTAFTGGVCSSLSQNIHQQPLEK